MVSFRLAVAWLLLYKTASDSLSGLSHSLKEEEGDRKAAKVELKKVRSLLLLLQNKMQTLGVSLPPRRRHKLDAGSLEKDLRK